MEKDSNPKFSNGAKKVPLASIPPMTTAYLALGHHEGVVKYGAWNWRAAGASAHTYVSAAKRHLDLWFEGQEKDPFTGVPHLANALASISILVDAIHSSALVDDRPIPSFYAADIGAINSMVEDLNKLFADKNPKHHTRINYDITNSSASPILQQSGTSAQLPKKVSARKTSARRRA